MSKKHPISRQAVVVVHGMGEQRPMETLRDFVSGVKAQLEAFDEKEKQSTIRSKPDSIGDIYETTRLSMDSTDNRPITDFYEFYWAHNMRGTQFSYMFSWIKHLVFTWVGKIPPRLVPVWWTVWSLLVTAPVITYFVTAQTTGSDGKGALATGFAAIVFPFILSAAGAFLKSVFLNSAGDAARYFTPEPDNIAERSHIRQQGIQFLKKLHELQTQEKVERIIVVAHSLGTIVTYDLLRLLWTEYNVIYDKLPEIDQHNLQALNSYADGTVILDDQSLEKYQELQFATWEEQKRLGNPWLVSDLITMGAAINAVDYFMVTSETIHNLIEQRELPVSPPVLDPDDHAFFYSSYPPYQVGNEERQVHLLHHGALFAVIRWTNIFYSSDFVGGPMQRIFGKGIKDICIPRKSPWFYPGGHTCYWDKTDKNNALKEIVAALRLPDAIPIANPPAQ